MKDNRELIQFGTFYRLMDPYTNDKGAWMVVSKDQKQAIVGVYNQMNRVNSGFVQIKLQGLNPSYDYEIEGRGIYGGDELMECGITPQELSSHPMSFLFGGVEPELSKDYDSILYVLKATEE
ncbi:MAG: GH36 C-terminal domain-containing protein [Holdemanella sp.]|nr:GH36 C-terminal domain-containing protein [Holdemanella sp.]